MLTSSRTKPLRSVLTYGITASAATSSASQRTRGRSGGWPAITGRNRASDRGFRLRLRVTSAGRPSLWQKLAGAGYRYGPTPSLRGYTMRRFAGCTLAVALTTVVFSSTSRAQDVGRKVEGGGITVTGWTGKIDPQEERAGLNLNSAKFAKEGDGFHITTGPAVTY